MNSTLESSYIVYGSILLAGLVVAGLLWLRNQLDAKRAAREAKLIAERRAAAEEAHRQMMDLAHREGLHMVGTLTSSIAHEFNNLLTPMMGYSMMALEQVSPEDSDLYDSLLEIYNAACKAKDIISRLSMISRKKSSLVFKFVAVDDSVRAVREVILPVKPQQVDLDVSLHCDGVEIFADETRLQQMLLNLCVNALQAMEDCEEGRLSLATALSANSAVIAVEDTGCGIPADKLEHIFEPFYTTKEARSGTGLGLAIVAQVASEMDARIEVDSQLGAGTRITISIPLPAASGDNVAAM